MRLGPFEINRRARAAAAAAPKPKPQGEIGASGTVLLDGFLQSTEYNSDLRGLLGVKKFQRMLASDGSVQEAIEHIYAPIRNATWTVEPPEDPDDDELLATAIADAALFDWLEQPWVEHLDGALEYLALGHAVFETPLQVVEEELRVCVPGEYDVAPDGRRTEKYRILPATQYVTLRRFAPRLQETIWRWYMTEGRLDAIEQQAFKDDQWGNWTIPAQQLLVLTHKRRGDDPTGRSILRAAHKAWVMKELIEKVAAVAVERHGVGVPVGYLPEKLENDDEALSRLEDILQDLRAGAFSYIAASGPKATATRDGYLFEILSPTGGIPDFTPLLMYQRAEIKAAVLARFAELGHQSTGARAVGDVQAVVWFAALGAVGTYLCEKHNEILKRIIDLNVKVSRYPKLTVSDIEVRNLAEFAQAQSQLVASGAVTADAPYRAYVRKGINAPEEAEPDAEDPGTTPPAPTDQPPPKPGDKPPAKNTDQYGRPIEAE